MTTVPCHVQSSVS